MDKKLFDNRLAALTAEHETIVNQKNEVDGLGNGWYDRYKNPVLTAGHVPLFWKYDLNHETNPYLMERLGINCVFNPGAIEHKGKILLYLCI